MQIDSVGCSHVYYIKGYDVDPANLKASKDKKVAVVSLESDFREEYRSSAQGHKFIFRNAKAFYEQAYFAALRDSVAAVEFFTKDPGPGFDIYLYPRLKLEVRPKGVGCSCWAQYEVVAKEKNGKEIARCSDAQEFYFGFIRSFDHGCDVCLLRSFANVDYDGLFESIDRE